MDGERLEDAGIHGLQKKKNSLVVFAFQPVNGLQVQYMQK